MMAGALSRIRTRLEHSLRHHWSSLASLATRALGVGAAFVVTILIGRWFGPEANGQYAIVTQTAMFLSVVAVGGLDLAVTREFSKTLALKVKLSRQTFFRVTGQAMLVALALMAVVWLGGPGLLRMLGRESVPATLVAVLCLILLARAFTRITAAVLRSQRDYVLGQTVELLLIPVFTIAIILLAGARSVSDILWATAAAGLVSAGIGLATSLRHTSSASNALRVPGRAVFATALPLWGVAVANNFAEWYGLATVSAVNGLYDAGLYRVAGQFASLLSIVALGLFGTYTTQISAAVHAGDKARVARLAGSATRLSTALVLPVGIALLVFAEPLLRLVGPEFDESVAILEILLVGQAIFTITGPCGLILALMGYGRLNLMLTIVTTVGILFCAPLIAETLGLVGVAAFVSAMLIFRNSVAFVALIRLERINVATGRLLVKGQ